MVKALNLLVFTLILCVAGSSNVVVFAADATSQPAIADRPLARALAHVSFSNVQVDSRANPGTPLFAPSASDTFAQRGYGRGRWRGNDGSRAAVILGSAAAIAGAAVLVYANRPECRTNPAASACGFGTKVVGGAVLAGGVVGITVGALSWR